MAAVQVFREVNFIVVKQRVALSVTSPDFT